MIILRCTHCKAGNEAECGTCRGNPYRPIGRNGFRLLVIRVLVECPPDTWWTTNGISGSVGATPGQIRSILNELIDEGMAEASVSSCKRKRTYRYRVPGPIVKPEEGTVA